MTPNSQPSKLKGLLRLPNSWAIDCDHALERATEAHAHAVALYHSRNEQHLRDWDLSWSQNRSDFQWQSRQLSAANQVWTAELAEGQRPEGAPERLSWSGLIRTQTGAKLKPAPAEGNRQDPRPLQVLGWIEWSAKAPSTGLGIVLTISYSIDGELQGTGLMFRALTSTLMTLGATAECPLLIEAHVREDNARSRVLLSRLQFEDEGVDLDFPAQHASGRWLRHHRYRRQLTK